MGTGASETRTGAVLVPLYGDRRARVLSEPLSTTERKEFIATNELRAVERLVMANPDLFEHRGPKTILLFLDNTVALGCLRNTASRSAPLQAILLRLVTYCARLGHVLKLQYIPSEFNPADAPSRWRDKSEYQLLPRWFREACTYLGSRPTCDRFASPTTALLPSYNTAYRSSTRVPVDAMAQVWAGSHSWLNPPFHLLLDVLCKLWAEGAEATLVVPLWPAEAWWPLLPRLADRVRVLPPHCPLFLGGETLAVLPPPRWGVAVVHIPAREPKANLPWAPAVHSALSRGLERRGQAWAAACAPHCRGGPSRTSARPRAQPPPIELESLLAPHWTPSH